MRAITSEAVKTSKSARRRNERLQHAQAEIMQQHEQEPKKLNNENNEVETKISKEKSVLPFEDIEIW